MTDENDDPPKGAEIHDLGKERQKRRPRKVAEAGPSDEGLATQFAGRMVHGWRYIADWDRWMVWTGEVWLRDEGKQIDWEGRVFCTEVAEKLTGKEQQRVLSGRTYKTVVRMSSCDPSLAVAVDDWDADELVINCKGVLVPLDGRPERTTLATDLVTKSPSVKPGGECPKWIEFLELVTGGDVELMGFLQRMCGYCLTGSTKEQVLFFLFGTGTNGKSTFINTITGILGDYAMSSPMEMLAATSARQSHDHTTELARLQGSRLVTANETGEGRHWDEARLKQLTGGDMISARFMNKDYFDYRPAFKLLVIGNHKPTLAGLDEALKRRVLIVPFTVRIPEEQRVLGFDEVLKAEWSGILSWMLR